MLPQEMFRFCPRCGAARDAENVGRVPLRCGGCGLTFFFNPTVAAAAWVFDPAGRALFLRRSHDPAKGKLGIPGGFIDAGETAEQALRREVREEVGIEVTGIAFLSSVTNLYHYRDVTYPVLDLVFTAAAIDPESARPLDGADEVMWRPPAGVEADELAFPSLRETLRVLRGESFCGTGLRPV
jgi:ADP-ribose pyrophosphatase YjhB (NUDIX family)